MQRPKVTSGLFTVAIRSIYGPQTRDSTMPQLIPNISRSIYSINAKGSMG